MPHYDYGKDYPFAAFITNLGKYNEGALVGEWVKFPTTAEELKKVFERIGIGAKDDFGQTYEEWFITDYDCYVDGLYDLLGEYANLDELNYLASKLDDMSQDEYERFQAAMEIGDHTGSIQELINLTENLDCYDIYPDIHDHDDLGRYYIEELDAMQVPEHLRNYIDYEAYGRDIALEESGQFTDLGYVRDTGDSFHEYYDGERGSIPEEYRVMTFQDDIPEEEISEWAMDIAYDMDEFFRQHDPQYAAEHPEEHAAKEEIYENLMAGRIITFQMMLKDKAGVLSEILAIFANCGANILTINQTIPHRRPRHGHHFGRDQQSQLHARGADPENRRKERRSQGGLRRGINHACISILRTHRDRIRRRQRQQAAGTAEEAEAFARARRLRRLEREKERIA